VSDCIWEPHPDDLLDGLPTEARQELDQVAREITVRDSMIYLDGKNWDGPTLGLRSERQRIPLHARQHPWQSPPPP
jgi:hypothetical protein